MFNKKIKRRTFISLIGLGLLGMASVLFRGSLIHKLKGSIVSFLKMIAPFSEVHQINRKYQEKKQDQLSEIYLASARTPYDNLGKILDMMGGIDKYIGKKDIIIIKPNAQWWNQGRTNLAAIKSFIDHILKIEGFDGEVIIAENNHFMDNSLPNDEKDNNRGWTHLSLINGSINGKKYNFNTLIEEYNNSGYKNITKYHWRDGGIKDNIWGNGQNGGIVTSVAEKDGYVWTKDDYVCSGFWGLKKWYVKMSYPVFTSKYSGISIDLKKGAFIREKDGVARFLPDRPIRLINFAVLNSHGTDTGITSAVKNYMGITDLSCGWWGLKPEGYVNVHACGGVFYPYAKGGPLGYFMKTIRKADMNIVTGEWVGWGSRTDPAKAAKMQTILGSTDPIALDYYSSKYILFPLSQRDYHNPDNPKSPVRKFLEIALESLGEGTLNEKQMKVYKI